MSGVWSARQVRDAALADNEALRQETAWYDERIREHDADVAAIDARLGEAWAHLGAVLVPDLDPARLDALALRIGLPAIGARAVEAGTRSELARQQGLRAAARRRCGISSSARPASSCWSSSAWTWISRSESASRSS